MHNVNIAMPFRRALLITVALSIVPAVSIILWTGVDHARYLSETVKTDAIRQAETVATIQEEIADSVRNVAETIAGLPKIREIDPEHAIVVLQSVLDSNARFLNVAITDTEGTVVVSPGLNTGSDLSDRAHIQEVIRTNRFSIGKYIIARVNGKPAFPFAVPIHDYDGAFVGVLSLVYPLDTYAELYQRLALPQNTIMTITDNQGVILHENPPNRFNPVGASIEVDIRREIMTSENETGTIVSHGFDGIERQYAYSKLRLFESSDPYIVVIVGIPVSVGTDRARRILIRNLVLMAVVVVAALLAATSLGYLALGRRLARLVETAELISSGDLDARTGIERDRSEIAEVAAALDEMAYRLALRIRETESKDIQLTKSLAEKDVLLREIHHRVKNNMQLILSIVNLQKSTTTDLDAFSRDLEFRIGAMASIHELLYESPEVTTIDVGTFLERLTSNLINSYDGVAIDVEADDTLLRIEIAMPLALITNELTTNAAKHSLNDNGREEERRGCRIRVLFRRMVETIELRIEDNGPGFPSDFSIENVHGLGLHLVYALVDQLSGSIEIETVQPRGSCVRVTIPVAI